MPKVGQFRFSLNGQTQMLDVWYKEKKFSLKGLPEEFVVLTDFHNYFGTEKEMRGYVNEKIELYQKLKTTERFSILYKCSGTTEIVMNKVDPHHFSGHGVGISKKIDLLNVAGGYGFSIEFKKVKIIDNGDRPVYYEIDIDTGEMDSYSRDLERSDFQEIPFTEERLQFFLGIAEAMKKTVMQISKFFDMDQNDAMLFVDSKQKLLS